MKEFEQGREIIKKVARNYIVVSMIKSAIYAIIAVGSLVAMVYVHPIWAIPFISSTYLFIHAINYRKNINVIFKRSLRTLELSEELCSFGSEAEREANDLAAQHINRLKNGADVTMSVNRLHKEMADLINGYRTS